MGTYCLRWRRTIMDSNNTTLSDSRPPVNNPPPTTPRLSTQADATTVAVGLIDTPGPIVVEAVIERTYVPLAADGLLR